MTELSPPTGPLASSFGAVARAMTASGTRAANRLATRPVGASLFPHDRPISFSCPHRTMSVQAPAVSVVFASVLASVSRLRAVRVSLHRRARVAVSAALAALSLCAPLAAMAQASQPAATPMPPPAAAPGEPQSVAWAIRVQHDGQTVDTFQHTTSVGQSRTDTHTYPVTLPAHCSGKDAAIVAKVKPERTRSVTVAPLYVDGDTVTLQLDVQETLDDGDGCSLAPRQIAANHPGLAVHGDSWTDWAPADKNAHLLYQVRAHVVKQD